MLGPASLWRSLTRRLRDPRFATILVLSPSSFAGMAMNFIVTVGMTHAFTKAEYGGVALAISISFFVGYMARFGAERVLVRDILQNPGESNEYITASYIIRTMNFGIVVAAIVALGLSGTAFRGGLLWIVLLFSLNGCVLSLAPAEIFDSAGKIKAHSLILLGSNLTYACAALALLLLLPESWRRPAAVGGIRLIATSIGVAVQFLWIRGLFNFCSFRRARRYLNPVFLTSLVVALPSLASTLMCQYPQWFIADALDRAKLAPYAISFQLATALTLALGHIARVMNPYLVKKVYPGASAGQIWSSLRKYLLLMILVSFPVCGALALLARPIIVLLFPPSYVTGVPALRILSLWVIVGTALSFPVAQVCLALKMHMVFASAQILGAVAVVVFTPILVSSRGITGGALSLMLSSAIALLCAGAALAARPRGWPERT